MQVLSMESLPSCHCAHRRMSVDCIILFFMLSSPVCILADQFEYLPQISGKIDLKMNYSSCSPTVTLCIYTAHEYRDW